MANGRLLFQALLQCTLVLINSLNYVCHIQSASEVVYVAEVLLRCSSESVKQAPDLPPHPAGKEEKGEMVVSIITYYPTSWVDIGQLNVTHSLQVVPVLLKHITKMSSIRLYLPKDLRSSDNRFSVGKSIQEVIRRFPDGVPLLDPIEDMNIKDEQFKKIIRV